jgi:hypothetical protein
VKLFSIFWSAGDGVVMNGGSLYIFLPENRLYLRLLDNVLTLSSLFHLDLLELDCHLHTGGFQSHL